MDAETTTSEAQWFYAKDNTKHGPTDRAAIIALLNAGTISRDTIIWHKGLQDWQPINQTDLLTDTALDLPPPLPASHVDNKLAWLIALTPLLGAFFEKVVTDYSSEPSNTALIAAYFAIYTILILVDVKQIEKGGHNPTNVNLGIWFWIVPAYLFKRATALGQPRYYFFTWIVAFVSATLITQPALLSESTYWGSGVPACDSNYAKRQVKNVFKDIPLVKLNGLQALDVKSPTERSNNGGKRICAAIVSASNGNDIQVTYSLEKTNDQIYIYMNIVQ